jgi:hypothetical protein
MILLTVISFLCALASMTTAFISIRRVYRKTSAKRRFIELLASPQVAPSLRNLWDEVMQDGVATRPELEQLVLALDDVARSLSRTDRQLILEGLRQRTALGRARYIASVMNRAGIAEGPLPVPVA